MPFLCAQIVSDQPYKPNEKWRHDNLFRENEEKLQAVVFALCESPVHLVEVKVVKIRQRQKQSFDVKEESCEKDN